MQYVACPFCLGHTGQPVRQLSFSEHFLFADEEQPANTSKPSSYTTSFTFTQGNFLGDDSLASHTFTGNTTVNLRILKATDTVLLHSVKQTFRSVNFSMTYEQPLCLCGEACNVTCTSVLTSLR